MCKFKLISTFVTEKSDQQHVCCAATLQYYVNTFSPIVMPTFYNENT